MKIEKRKRSPWRRILWISGLFVVALLGATVYAQSYKSTAAEDLEAVKAKGFPTTYPEIQQLYPREAGDDSAPYYVEFQKLLKDIPSKDKPDFTSFRSAPLVSLTDAQITAGASKFRYMEASLISASQCPAWQPKDATRFPTFDQYAAATSVGTSVRLLRRFAIADGRAHKPADAISKLQGCTRMIKQASNFPGVNAALLSMSYDGGNVEALIDVVQHNPDPVTLKLAADMLDALPPQPRFFNVFQSEFVRMVDELERMRNQPHDDDLFNAFARKFWRDAQEKRMSDLVVRQYREVFDAVPNNPNDIRAMRKVIQLVQAKHRKDLERYPSADVLDSTLQTVDGWQGQLARRRVAAMGIRMMEAKVQSGVYPSSLPEFYGREAIDPFTGKALIYKMTGSGFTLYSVGIDRTDDGGKPRGVGSGYDLVFQSP